MPHPSVYHTDDGRHYTPQTFTIEFNRHSDLFVAAKAMGISRPRLSVIATRLRQRGWKVKFMVKPLDKR